MFADAKLDAAIDDIVGLKFANGGQICVSPNRAYIEASVYGEFLEKAAAKAAAYTFGSGDADKAPGATILQPVVSEDALKRLLQLISDAVEKGARLVCGGNRVNKAGFFLEPTILAEVTDAMDLSCTEIFGPILAVRSFDDRNAVFDKCVGLS